MGFFPARPTIELFVPESLFVGKPATLELAVTAEDDTHITGIVLDVVGIQGWRVGSGKSAVTHQIHAPELRYTLMTTATTLLAGETQRFKVRVELPGRTPPSHALSPAWARLEATVRVEIPWWPDARQTHQLPVRLVPPRTLERTPASIRGRTSSADDPRLEISLASTNLVAGEVLGGSVAAFHLPDHKAREIQIELVPQLHLHRGGHTRERQAQALAITVTLPANSAGTAIPFQIALPSSLTPSFEATTHSLHWFLAATTGSFFTGKTRVEVPITIHDRSALDSAPELAAAPPLGDERIDALFARFAVRHGWRHLPPDSPNAIPPDAAVSGDHAKTTLEIAYDYRNEGGACLVSRVRHPSLGLGLTVVPSGTLRHLFFEDIEVDIADWDRAHRVTARSRDQTTPFLKSVIGTLRDLGQLGVMTRWDDDAITFEREVLDLDDKTLNDTRLLLQFVASTIMDARESIAPPAGITIDVAAWRALATELDGDLAIGELAIDGGRVHGLPTELALTFSDDKPRAFRIAVGATDAASGPLRELAWTLARPASDVLGANVSPTIVDRLTRWPPNVTDLHVKDGIARLTVGLDGPHDAATLGKLAESLAVVLAELDPASGPYR